jgi:hypothetical protein
MTTSTSMDPKRKPEYIPKLGEIIDQIPNFGTIGPAKVWAACMNPKGKVYQFKDRFYCAHPDGAIAKSLEREGGIALN